MKQLYLISFLLILSLLYCSRDDSQIYIEGKVIFSQSADPIPSARVELSKLGESGDFLTGINREVVTSTKTDSLGNYKIQEKIEDCSGLEIHVYKDGFHQIGQYEPKCTLGTRWQRFDIILDSDE